MPCYQGTHSQTSSLGHLEIWSHLLAPTPPRWWCHASSLLPVILHPPFFLGTGNTTLPIPCQDYLWAHLPYFSGTQIKGGGSTLSPNYAAVLSPCSLFPLPLQFRISYLFIDLFPYFFNSVPWVPTMGQRCCCAKSLQLCPTLCYLWTVACQAPLSTGIL